MSLKISKLDDTRKRFQNNYAISYGPLVLAAVTPSRTESFNITLVGDLASPASWITRDSTDLSFTARGMDRQPLKLIPLAFVVEELYIVYFDNNPAPPLHSISATLNGATMYLRHSGPDFWNNFIYLTPVSSSGQEEQSTFISLQGLAQERVSGEGQADSLISFEGFHWDPGFYMIHNLASGDPNFNWTLQIATAGPTPWPQDFQNKASFWVRPGLANSGMVSFESFEMPGYYISTYQQESPCSPSTCQNLCGYNTCTKVYLRRLVNSNEFHQASTFALTNPTWKPTLQDLSSPEKKTNHHTPRKKVLQTHSQSPVIHIL